MIILSADVHHKSMGGRDQKLLGRSQTELMLLEQYLEIANRKKIWPTVYLTGCIADNEENLLQRLTKDYDWEVGGHTFNAYQPWLLWGSLRRLNRRKWPLGYQQWDISKTQQALKEVTGKIIVSWRNHAYLCDENTNDVLESFGFKTVSNIVANADPYYVSNEKALLEIPINTLVDHDSLPHSYGGSKTDTKSWLALLRKQVEANELQGRHSMLLIHPICQSIEDHFYAFRNLIDFLADMPVITAAEFHNQWSVQIKSVNATCIS